MSDYGIDVSTFPDLDATFALISGPRVVAENVARRWEVLLQGAINARMDAQGIRVLQAALRKEALDDERVLDADVRAALASPVLTVSASLALLTGETFSLVLNASAVSVEVLIGNP